MSVVGVRVVALLALLAAVGVPQSLPAPARAQSHAAGVRIAASAPLTWDPALAGDASSAAILAQIFEGLTAFDAQSRVQPALASRWQVEEDGRRIVFQLRPEVRYSDGSPVLAEHVVESWLRLLEPARPSPLVSLLTDISGASEYLAGRGDRDDVGLRAEGDTIIVDFRRPAAYFLSVTASPSLAVVPPEMHGRLAERTLPGDVIASGGYVPTAGSGLSESGVIRLEANPHYWAGEPAIETIDVVTELGSQSPVAAFQAGEVDYAPVASYDASWIRYDATLGPQLRQTETFSVHYYGFDTTAPPFDDARVRLAFAKAVDWDRIVRLAGDAQPASSLLPPGIPARSEEDFSPPYSPGEARELLAAAGFEGGAGFPEVALVSFGYGYEAAVANELEQALGISVTVELMDFEHYFGRLGGDEPPAFWTLSWIADYPHPHDFLGVLLETGSTNNYGGWSDASYDAAIEAAAAATDPAEQERHYAEAQRILRDEAAIVPVDYGVSWALSRDGLLGAVESGVGMVRFAGLEWTESGR